jgi:hypothetical protein
MTRFYFHQWIDGELLHDPDGCDFSSVAEARMSAMISARRLWAEAIVEGEDLTGQSIQIADSSGHCVAIVPLVDALPFRLRCSAERNVEAA